MTEEDMRKELIKFIRDEFGSSTKAAEAWDVGRSFISKVTTGQKPMPEWMLNKIGYARKIVRIK